jgi:hypothetical protein
METDDRTQEDWIRLHAYLLWEADGCPDGQADIYWHRARRLFEEHEGATKRNADEPGATVDEQIDDSFPASDPPSYNAGGRVGGPSRPRKR